MSERYRGFFVIYPAMQENYYVYIIESLTDSTLYKGYTTNYKRRQ
ncbi:MAG TPA: hypothetical protein PK252_14450 [Bacteroidales bacterium]|nr:hypothetical protein [Bacteroidales bacterium]